MCIPIISRNFFSRKKQHQCERCGLYFEYKPDKKNASAIPICPHCGDLKTETELNELLAKKAEEHESNASLGFAFVVIAVILGIILLLGFIL